MKSQSWRSIINAEPVFWRKLSLAQMSPEQWESLCDGCGRCCLHKIARAGTRVFTCVACRLFDIEACGCKRYSERQALVPDCIVLKPEMTAKQYSWLPGSCAYRRLAEGRGLASWHPLVSGSPESVRKAGLTVSDLAIPERQALRFDTLETYVTSLSAAPER